MTIIVDRESVRRLLDLDDALELTRQAHIHSARGEAFIGSAGQLGRRVDGRRLHGLSATFSGIPVVGMHSSYAFTNDVGRLQTQGYILLQNFSNGQLAAIVEASLISQLAKACNAALASEYLMPADAKVHTIIADQVNARQLARAVARVAKLEECRLVSTDSADEIGLLADWIGKTSGVRTVHTADMAGAVSDADIISLDGSSDDWMLKGTQLRPGTHINSLGATEAGVRELDTFAVQRCMVVCDHAEHSRSCAGNLLAAVEEDKWQWERMHGELGQVITGDVDGRTEAEQITLYNGSGMPLSEVVLAWEVQLRALEQGQGQQVTLG
ncbi:MAG: ornithine cyclodeaminase family protein [Planctomycetales bacterium]|nr:ornithine cyclodeaminase family protein [bacterium]UNM07866.1 MAG: ornithine cyclodeaminase family protein [Planctomycetales bacterium]